MKLNKDIRIRNVCYLNSYFYPVLLAGSLVLKLSVMDLPYIRIYPKQLFLSVK